MDDPRPTCVQCSVINDTVCVHHLMHDAMTDADAYRTRAEKAEADRDEWKHTAQALRVEMGHVSGILMDVDWSSPDSMSNSLAEIEDILCVTRGDNAGPPRQVPAGPRPTSGGSPPGRCRPC